MELELDDVERLADANLDENLVRVEVEPRSIHLVQSRYLMCSARGRASCHQRCLFGVKRGNSMSTACLLEEPLEAREASRAWESCSELRVSRSMYDDMPPMYLIEICGELALWSYWLYDSRERA